MNLTLHSHWDRHPAHIQRQLIWLKTGQIYQPPSRALMVAFTVFLMPMFGWFGWHLNMVFPVVVGVLFHIGVWWAYLFGRSMTYRRRSCALVKATLECPPHPVSGQVHLTLHPLRAYEREHGLYGEWGDDLLAPTQDVSCEVWDSSSGQPWEFFINPRASHVYFKLHEWPEGSWAADIYYHPDVPWPVLVVTEADVLFPFEQPKPLREAKVAA